MKKVTMVRNGKKVVMHIHESEMWDEIGKMDEKGYTLVSIEDAR